MFIQNTVGYSAGGDGVNWALTSKLTCSVQPFTLRADIGSTFPVYGIFITYFKTVNP